MSQPDLAKLVKRVEALEKDMGAIRSMTKFEAIVKKHEQDKLKELDKESAAIEKRIAQLEKEVEALKKNALRAR